MWLRSLLNAAVAGVLIGWTVENVPIESLGIGGWVRSLVVRRRSRIAAPVAGAVALATVPGARRALRGIIGATRRSARKRGSADARACC